MDRHGMSHPSGVLLCLYFRRGEEVRFGIRVGEGGSRVYGSVLWKIGFVMFPFRLVVSLMRRRRARRVVNDGALGGERVGRLVGKARDERWLLAIRSGLGSGRELGIDSGLCGLQDGWSSTWVMTLSKLSIVVPSDVHSGYERLDLFCGLYGSQRRRGSRK